MRKLYTLFMLLIFVFIFVGCKSEEREYFNLSIYDSNNIESYNNDILLYSNRLIDILKNDDQIKLKVVDYAIDSIGDITKQSNQYWEVYINDVLFTSDINFLTIKNNDKLKFILKETPSKEKESFKVIVQDQQNQLLIEKDFELTKAFNLVEGLRNDVDLDLELDQNNQVSKVYNIDISLNEYLFWDIYLNDILINENIGSVVITDNDVLKFKLREENPPVKDKIKVIVVNDLGQKLIEKQILKIDYNFLDLLILDNEINLGIDDNNQVIKVFNIDTSTNQYLHWEIYINELLISNSINELNLYNNDIISFRLINTYIKVERVEAFSDNYDLRTGFVTNINYNVFPENAIKKNVSFRSTDNSVLNVDEYGRVTAVYKGIASIIISVDGIETSIEYDVRHKKLIDMTPEEENAITDEDFEELYEEFLEDERLIYANEVTRLVATFENNIPSDTTNDLDFVKLSDIRGIYITLKSSDEVSISALGKVYRKSKDVLVRLTYTVNSPDETVTIVKDVIVKGFYMPDRKENNLTFAYLFNTTYKGFREEDIKKLDVINFGFAGIGDDHKVNISGLNNNIYEILKLRQQGVRVVLCIGGWGVDGFSQAVANSDTRRILINSIIDVIYKYDFDGVDLDWEYPGRTAGGLIGADPINDKRNFSLLLKELREALDLVDNKLIISAAVPAGGSASLYEVNELNKYLTYLHLMTYDLSMSGTTSHHTALFKSKNTA